LQRYVHNQGSGWNYVIEYLHRYLDQQLTLAPDEGDTAAAAAAATTAEGSATTSPASVPKSSPIDTPARGATPAAAAGAAAVSAGAPTPHASFLTLVAMIGQRTGELHV